MNNELKIGQQVVRTKGQDMVGAIGAILSIDNAKNKVRVDWGNITTTININSVALTSIPYRIQEAKNYIDSKGVYRIQFQKYIAL
jgi:hypothetical protein